MKSPTTPPRRKRRRRPSGQSKPDTRFPVRPLAMEYQGPDGPRLDLAFFSLPLMKGGAR